MPLAEANDKLESIFRHLEPCGMGNPSPVLMVHGVSMKGSPRAIGKDGLKVEFTQGEDSITAIGWNLAPRRAELAENVSYDVAFRLERDEYRGTSRLQARLVDFRPI
jgi:single-stranded-DNA-specific exonuclease